MLPKIRVSIYYDVVSPYSWIGFEGLCRYRDAWNLDLHFKPCFLGGIMAASGNKPPAMVPAKGAYMTKDIERLAKFWRLPLKAHEDFASVMFGGTTNAMRLLTVLSQKHPHKVEALSRELWSRLWSRNQHVKESSDLMEALKAVGFGESDASQLVGAIADEKVKAALKATTAEAIAKGAFGAPWIVIETFKGEEYVFGADRFHVIADMLGTSWDGAYPTTSKSRL